jgi:hypothetical protein
MTNSGDIMNQKKPPARKPLKHDQPAGEAWQNKGWKQNMQKTPAGPPVGKGSNYGELVDGTRAAKGANAAPVLITESLLEKDPALRGHLESEMDRLVSQAHSALYTGDLYFAVYSGEEIRSALGLVAEAIGLTPSLSAKGAIRPQAGLPDNTEDIILQRLHRFITTTMTPPRLDQLRQKLGMIERHPPQGDKWIPFIVMTREGLQQEDALEKQRPFLINALLGEMKTSTKVRRVQ